MARCSIHSHDDVESQEAGIIMARDITGWIDVKERLPDAEEDVLVNTEYCMDVGCFEIELQRWNLGSKGVMENITHWMPLPPPPTPL